MAKVKSANPRAVTLEIAGFRVEGGLADGEYFTAEPASDSVLEVVGTDGEVSISQSSDGRWNCVLKLMETSDVGVFLAQLYNLRKRGNGTTGVFPFLYKDADTGEVLTGPDAWIKKAPSVSKDRQATSREWQITIGSAEYEMI